MFKSIALIIALSAAPLAIAQAPAAAKSPTPVAVESGDFAAQRAAIEKALGDGKTYVEISSADRSDVRTALDRMSRLLDGGKTTESLTEDQKVELFNQQEIINTLLTRAASDSRVVCDRIEKTGSHRKITVCRTVAERDRRRQTDQDKFLNDRKIILPQGG